MARKVNLGRLGFLGLLGLLVWMDRQARLERRVRRVMTVQRARGEHLWLAPPERLAHPAYPAPRVVPDRQVPRAHRAR